MFSLTYPAISVRSIGFTVLVPERFLIRADTLYPFLSHLHESLFRVDADPLSADLLGGHAGRAGAGKRIENHIALLGQELYKPGGQGDGKGGCMAAVIALRGHVENVIGVDHVAADPVGDVFTEPTADVYKRQVVMRGLIDRKGEQFGYLIGNVLYTMDGEPSGRLEGETILDLGGKPMWRVVGDGVYAFKGLETIGYLTEERNDDLYRD